MISAYKLHRSNPFTSKQPELLVFDESCLGNEYFETRKGCISLSQVRSAYFGGFISDKKVEDLYVEWRDTWEYLWMDGYDPTGNFVKTCFVKSSKRGNDVYKALVKERFSYIDSLPPIFFFDDCHSIKRTPMIFVTLTVDPRKYSKHEAWRSISYELNKFETRLRQLVTYWLKKQGLQHLKGSFVSLKSFEAHESGYPHIHATYFFHNWSFIVFPHYRGNEDIEYRLPDKFSKQIQRLWSMGSNVKIQGVQDTLGAFSEIRKYVTKEIFSPKSVKTCAMLWVYRKNSYSLSRCNPFDKKLPKSIVLVKDIFERDRLTREYLSKNIEKWRSNDFIGSIWGAETYLQLYSKKLCGGVAEPTTTDLVCDTMRDYNNAEPEIAFFKFRGSVKRDDLALFFDNLPEKWFLPVDPPPELMAEMRFFFGIDTVSYESITDANNMIVLDRRTILMNEQENRLRLMCGLEASECP